jgi:hypothetical protein
MPDPSAINNKISEISSEFLMGERGNLQSGRHFPTQALT